MVLAVLVVLGVIGAVAGKTNHPQTTSGTAVTVPNRAATPAGFVTFRNQESTFTIAVPASWKQLDMGSPSAQSMLDAVEALNPRLRQTLGTSAAALIARGIQFMAINPQPDSDGFASNVNVLSRPAPTFSDSDFSQIAADLRTEYAKLGASLTGTSVVTLDGRRALKSTARMQLNTGAGTLQADETQYFVGAGGYLYVISLTGDDPALPTVAGTFSAG